MITAQTMLNHAKQALGHAYAPYSHFRVASCLCSEDDYLFTGVNVENASYGLTLCAETSAICQMISAGQQKIKSLLLINDRNSFCFPCGACRQRIIEFATPNTLIHSCSENSIIKTLCINELLPDAFKFKPI